MEEKSMFAVLAIVALFAAAGVFFTLSNDGPSVVYVQSGASEAVSAAPARASVPARILTAPFRVLGKGITGAAEVQIGNATTNFTNVTDLVMNKSIISCSASLDSGSVTAYLNTCNDNGSIGGTPNSGGTITCDGGTNATADPATCDGGFQLTNAGRNATLVAKLNASSGPVDNINTYLVDINGCNSTNTVASPGSLVTLNSTDQTLCTTMVGNGAVCQCMALDINSPSNMASAKSGTPVTFRKQDTLTT